MLVVDDEVEQQTGFVESLVESGVRAEALYPQDVTREDVIDADLVLVDYFLEHWPERNVGESASIQPQNGAALAAVLRSHVDPEKDPPKAFAIRTGQVDRLPTEFPRPMREHAFARSQNLEWIFTKESDDLARRVGVLAHAIAALPADWSEDEERRFAATRDLLVLGAQNWTDIAWEEVLRCHPPMHELARGSDGIALLRWLLHRIVPYPCFLYDRHRLAVRSGLHIDFVDRALESGFGDLLAPARYTGLLAGFLGDRWWGQGVETILWDRTERQLQGTGAARAVVEEFIDVDVESLGVRHPVFAIDAEYRPLDSPRDIEECVEVQPDDWPPFADTPWVTRDLARESKRMRAMIVDLDPDAAAGDQD